MQLKEFGHETLHTVSWHEYQKHVLLHLRKKLSSLKKLIFLLVVICYQDENVVDSPTTPFLLM